MILLEFPISRIFFKLQQQGQVISIGTGQNQQLINVLPLNQVNQDPLFVQVQPQQVNKQLLTITNSKDFPIHTG